VINIPFSFMVTSGSFRKFMQMNRLAEVVEGLLARVDVKWIEEIQSPAAQIKEIIQIAPVPEPIYTSITEGYQRLGGGARFVWTAIPPSTIYCTREFTQSSYLKVTGLAETIVAIKWWWASLFDANLIFHREFNGQRHEDAGITVVANSHWPPSPEPGEGDPPGRSGDPLAVHPYPNQRWS
jgi:phosphoenolpyruvate synthase/pyruvate phosphate dikinase